MSEHSTMSNHSEMPHTSWVCDDQTLQHVASHWVTCPWISIDTEFIRRNTFYPKPALLQVYDGTTLVLVDPTRISCWQPLADVLNTTMVLKIMHAPQEDMDVLKLLTNTVPQPLFDTQLAAAFCGLHYPCSYQNLLRTLLNIEIDKEETCSDWLKRPLSKTQINYASKDVYYLPALYHRLTHKMQESGYNKLSWLNEECKLLVQHALAEIDPQDAWKEIKLTRRLHPKQHKVLKALCAWRETHIRQYNIPRKRALNNEHLLNISRQQPTKLYHLQRVPGLSPTLIRQYGKKIIAVVATAQQQNDEPIHHGNNPHKPPIEMRATFNYLQTACEHTCVDISIHPALLPGKKYANTIIQHWIETGRFEAPTTITHWKRTLLNTVIDTLKKDPKWVTIITHSHSS